MNLQCQESELSKPSIRDTTPPRPYLLSKPPQQSHLWGTENSNAVGYRGCLIQTASGLGISSLEDLGGWKLWSRLPPSPGTHKARV